jgi:hypothetical protein
MSREAFEAFYMTLAESNRSDLYRTTKPFRGVQIGDYKWVVTRSMYIGWQADEQTEINELKAELEKAKELLNDSCCYSHGEASFPDECQWCFEVQELLKGYNK